MKYAVAIIAVVMFIARNSVAQDEELPLVNKKDTDVDVELKMTMPAPFVNGYIWSISGTAAVQFNKLVSIDVRGGVMSHGLSDKLNYLTADVGLVPVIHDRRRGERGWVTQAGAAIGYAFDWGKVANEEYDDDYNVRYHLITGNLILKNTHWWNAHIGMIFQLRLIGAVSFHTWYEHWGENYDSGADELLEQVSEFYFGDQKFGGLQFSMGVAF